MAQTGRTLAARCVRDVETGGFSNLVLKRALASCGLDSRERRFCSAIVMGTLERLITIDYILTPLLSRPLARLDAEVRAVLETGLYQCLYMDGVPTHAAISESVNTVRALGKSSAAGLVNAVLRRSATFDVLSIDNIHDKTERLSIKYSLSRQLVELFCTQYGDSAERMMQSFFITPQNTVRVNTLRISPKELIDELESQGITAHPAQVEGALTLEGDGWLSVPAFSRGDMRVQSIAAQTAALALDAKSDMNVLDMCAAPGGKTLTAAQCMCGKGKITALDRSRKRLDLIDKQAALEGIDIVRTICADASNFDSRDCFDRVLCDVPCSGLGEIASKPELRWRPLPDDGALWSLQLSILKNGARLLKKGGRLIYSTCTLDCRENEDIVNAFLSERDDFAPVKLESGSHIRKFVPSEDNYEGFFIACFERVC